MKEIDRLPERAIHEEISNQLADGSELKAYQRLGSDSVQTTRIFSGNTYDLEFVGIGSFKQHRAAIEFIPSDKRFGGALCHRLVAQVLDNTNTPIRTLLTIDRERTVDNRQRWLITYDTFGDASTTRRVKLYFFATGSGTFTANVLT